MEIKEINNTNRHDVNKLYIHDTYFTDIDIDANNKIVRIEVSEDYSRRHYKMTFENVIKFDLSKLCLWGKTKNQILEMYLENCDVKKYIQEKEDSERKLQEGLNIVKSSASYGGDTEKLFSIGILTDSGDRIIIICEKISFIDLCEK